MVNTNGFKRLLEQSLLEEHGIEQQKTKLQDLLTPFYKELGALKERYNFDKLQSEGVDLNHRASVQASITDYYRFRMLVDGLYNLLAIYGSDHYSNLFRWLKNNYAIYIYTSTNHFATLYNDDICHLSPDDGCTSRTYIANNTKAVWYASADYEFSVEFPIAIDLDNVLIASENFLEQLSAEKLKKNEEKEYQEYLRLKEKFGDKKC